MKLELNVAVASIALCMTMMAVPVTAADKTRSFLADPAWFTIFRNSCASIVDYVVDYPADAGQRTKALVIPAGGIPLYYPTNPPDLFRPTGNRLTARDFVVTGPSRNGFTCVYGTGVKTKGGTAPGILDWVRSSAVKTKDDEGPGMPLSGWVGDWKSEMDNFTEIVIQPESDGKVSLTLMAERADELEAGPPLMTYAEISGRPIGNRLKAGNMGPLYDGCQLLAVIISHKMLVTDNNSCGARRSTFFSNVLIRIFHGVKTRNRHGGKTAGLTAF